MKAGSRIFLLFFCVTFIACDKTEEPVAKHSNSLIGNWANPVVEDEYWQYERVESLEEQKPGISFLSDHSFIERGNVGWCGTPPIYYVDYEGSWTQKGAVVDISVAFWGGTKELQWKIVSVDDMHLTIQVIKEESIISENE